MNYLGIDVHTLTTVFCVLDDHGEVIAQGKVPTTRDGFLEMLGRCGGPDQILAGQEVGKMAYFVYDTLTGMGVSVRSFNAYHLRMIASSRKKTDKRDAYWMAKALQTGMTPHPVYIPTGQIRQLRRLVARRTAVVRERRTWLLRGRSYLEAEGYKLARAHRAVARLVASAVDNPQGLDADLYEGGIKAPPKPTTPPLASHDFPGGCHHRSHQRTTALVSQLHGLARSPNS